MNSTRRKTKEKLFNGQKALIWNVSRPYPINIYYANASDQSRSRRSMRESMNWFFVDCATTKRKRIRNPFSVLNIKRYKFESNGWDYLWVYFTFEFICRSQIHSTVTLEFMIASYRIPKLISSFCVCQSIGSSPSHHQLIQMANTVHILPSRGCAINFIDARHIARRHIRCCSGWIKINEINQMYNLQCVGGLTSKSG